MQELNFSNCSVNKLKLYGGINGRKIGIEYQGKIYMLKFPPLPSKSEVMSYTNSCISEYIGCHIMQSLGIETQQTLLGLHGDKVVVACKDFETTGIRLKDFAFLKNAVIDSTQNGYGTELNDILLTIKEQDLIPVNQLEDFFWELFIADSFLGNFDRHNGNWGFLIHESLAQATIAPVFDCGSCLYPQLDVASMDYVLSHPAEVEKRVFLYPTSAIKNQGVKINYGKFLLNTHHDRCLWALERISSRIDFDVIDRIIEDTPFIASVQKRFFKTMLREREKHILQPALERMKSLDKQECVGPDETFNSDVAFELDI